MCISSHLVRNIGIAVFAGIAAFAGKAKFTGLAVFTGIDVFARLRCLNVITKVYKYVCRYIQYLPYVHNPESTLEDFTD